MESDKKIKVPTLKLPLTGVSRLKRIFEILNLSFGWNLQPRDFSVVAEIYNKNQKLIEEGVTDQKVRMTYLLSKEHKDKIGKKYNMNYHAVANTLTKMRRNGSGQFLLSEKGLHPAFSKLSGNSEELELKISFYNPNGRKEGT